LQDRSPESAAIAGPGLLDMTRLALSSYDLWSDILKTNAPAVEAALDAYIAKLQQFKDDFATDFAKGAAFANSLRTR
jgi:prephenate dehydrogenase